MTYRRNTLSALSLALLAGVMFSGISPVAAAGKTAKNSVTDPVEIAAGKNSAEEALATRLSNEGYNAMREIKGARVAIFNNLPKLANKFIAEAAKNLEAAAKDDTKYATKTGTADTGSAADKLIPIDGGLFVVDNFTATPEKKAQIAKANEHLKKGNRKKAIETLRLASIDVAFQRVLMPVGRTIEHVKAATDLLNQKKYYEANLALKAAEEGLTVDTNALTDPVAKAKKKSN